MKRGLLIAVLLLIVPIAYAQLPWAITDLRCGNDKVDQFEMCEPDLDEPNFCDDLAEMLEIDTVCDYQHCTCLPRVNKAFCGNDKREGVELCDGTGPNLCAEFGERMNLSLKCDPSTCGCQLNDTTVPADYNPLVVEELENLSSTPSSCGDKKVERAEDCDPPNTLCTTDLGEAGICTDKCRCVEPGALDDDESDDAEPEEEGDEEVEVGVSDDENISDDSNVSDKVSKTEESDDSNVSDEKAAEEKGFFGKLWSWLAALFS